jgi:hypothetical protein
MASTPRSASPVWGAYRCCRAVHTFGEMSELIQSGRLSLPIAQDLPPAEVAEAHQVSRQCLGRGKLVPLAGRAQTPYSGERVRLRARERGGRPRATPGRSHARASGGPPCSERVGRRRSAHRALPLLTGHCVTSGR